ncbi:unnamed protein product [Blepharisma stoltei]|uniref:Uncharacterized protein n=1 Tax=Blepharisma stoltei TaxID=1481888 RepID=A0AAU9IR31_9CILI|nr:unnamed protein product [Blepharisma stoltei]
MRRSLSVKSIDGSVASFSQNTPILNYLLERNQKKRINSTSQWDGFMLKKLENGQENTRRIKSPQRWKEFTNGIRTVDPTYPVQEDKPITNPKSVKNLNSGNLTQMIFQGHSKDELGNMHKQVLKEGKRVHNNANSSEDYVEKSIVDTYKKKNFYFGSNNKTEKRLRRENSISVDKKQSQITTIPGPHKPFYERPQTVKVKRDFISQISELPGSLKSSEPDLDSYNPWIKLSRQTITSVESEKIYGTPRARNGPKREILPGNIQHFSSYSSIGEQIEFHPHYKGKLTDKEASKRLLSPSRMEDSGFTKRSKPENARDMFRSSISILG